jgi:hypothetical protein
VLKSLERDKKNKTKYKLINLKMKRFTSFMLMLLVAVTTWAGPTDLPQITTDLENPIYYTIVNTRSHEPGGYMYFAGENVGIKDEQVAKIEAKHKFYFTGSHDALYVHNAAAHGLKLATIGNGNKAAGSWTAEGSEWAVGVSPKGNGLAFGPKGGLNGNSCWNECNYQTAKDKPDFTTWSANDDGSIFLVALAEDCEININGFYTIEAPLFEATQGVKKGLVVNEDGSLGWNTVDLTNKNHYWVPTTVNGQTVALKNLGTEKYLNGTEVSADYVASTVKALGLGQYNIVSNSTTVHANNHGGGANASGNIVSWGGAVGSASAWQFVEQQDPDAVKPIAITYNFTYNGQALDGYTQTVNTVTGAEYPNITVSFPFGVSATKPEGTIAVEDAPAKTITIAVEENLPFVYAASYKAITNWYYVNVRDDGPTYMYYDSSISYIKATETAVPADKKDAYSWAFIGDPFSGFEIVNLAAGKTMVLSSPQAPNGNQNAEQIARMVVKEGATGNTDWDFVKPTHNGAAANGFYIQHPTEKSYAINRQGYNGANTLCYWTGRDTGSTFQVVKRPSEEEEQKALVAEFKTRAIEGLGCVGGYAADKADAINAINTYADMETFKAENKVITFDGNKFYRIQNVFRKTFIDIDNNNRVLGDENHADIDQLWQVEAGTDGAYFIKSPNAGYMQAVGNNELVAETDAQFVISSFYEGAGQFGIISKGTNNMLAGINASALGTWWNGTIDGDMSYRFIEANDVEITLSDINGEGWATTYLPFDVTLSDGLKAYYVNEINTGYVTFAETTDVPANNGVILRGEPGEYTLNIAKASSTITGNYLSGTTVTKEITKEDGNAYYVLAKHEEAGLGFYNAVLGEDETKFKNVANKAYLVVPTEQAQDVKSLSFRFEDGTTAIEGVEVENEVKAIFDLTGRRVEAITAPGIYIVGGKKVLVK